GRARRRAAGAARAAAARRLSPLLRGSRLRRDRCDVGDQRGHRRLELAQRPPRSAATARRGGNAMTDRDTRIEELLDRCTPATIDYSPDWHDVLERAGTRRSARAMPPSRRSLGLSAASLTAAAVALAMAVTTPWNAG